MLKERGAAEVVPRPGGLGQGARPRRSRASSIIGWKRSGPIRHSTSPSPSCSARCSTRAIRASARRRPGSSGSGSAGCPIPLALLARRVADDDPRVRLEAVRALAHLPGLKSAEIALRALDRPVDPFLDYALWLTARQLQSSWLPEVQAGPVRLRGQPAAPGLRAPGGRLSRRPQAVARPVPGRARARRRDESVQTLIATLGGPARAGAGARPGRGTGRADRPAPGRAARAP